MWKLVGLTLHKLLPVDCIVVMMLSESLVSSHIRHRQDFRIKLGLVQAETRTEKNDAYFE